MAWSAGLKGSDDLSSGQEFEPGGLNLSLHAWVLKLGYGLGCRDMDLQSPIWATIKGIGLELQIWALRVGFEF